MPSYDDDRRELFTLLEPSLGRRGATLLMDHLPPAGWADLATKSDLGEVRGEMAMLRAEFKGEMATLRAEFIEKLSDTQTRIQTTTLVSTFGAMIGLSGLVFAVAEFAR